jgi:hypothetical protein
VTNAQIHKSRRFPGLLIVFMLPRRYREFASAHDSAIGDRNGRYRFLGSSAGLT